jgi:arginyl-tRNA synthetase
MRGYRLKAELAQLIVRALDALSEDVLPAAQRPRQISIERTRDASHGDFATNIALTLAKPARKPPRELAQNIVDAIPDSALVERIEIAGPGFINFFVSPQAYHDAVITAVEAGERYGRLDIGAGEPVLLEFVSANPTGPLHVGHGRGAACGASLANLLEAAGYEVTREYYINDAGRQMDILAVSVWLRYLERCEQRITFPSNGYRGDYVYRIADRLKTDHGERFVRPVERITADLPADESAGGNREAHIDALIARAKTLLGETEYKRVFDAGVDSILADIRDDLEHFGVHYDSWFSERSLVDSGAVEQTLKQLEKAGHLYRSEGALWFRAREFGDDKDRVVVRENGLTTYFAADLAYHLDKHKRGFQRWINIWGADHHGYVPRLKAGLQALGEDAERLEVLLVQFAILYRGAERVPMSTRAGQFVTLRELREEVGTDAARFFYVMRSHDQHLDFDLELAKSQSADNPVYYIQYAHARICSVYEQLRERQLDYDAAAGKAALARLREPHEQDLMVAVCRFPEVVESAAQAFAPHQVAQYLRELAQALHTYYNAHTFLVEEDELRNARLYLISAVRNVLANGLRLLGVSAPEAM